MSAIFGLLYFHDRSLISGELELMAAALAAHGPAGGGIWSHDTIGLGQRLHCFTPEDLLERQPLQNAGGDFALVSNGRIDNRPELTARLDIPRSEALKLPDSAFILQAYEKWGAECVSHLVGEYSFALWDGREQRLVLSRSPCGGDSLFYHANRERFAFATMPKGLFSLPSIRREIDPECLADHLAFVPVEPGRTLYRSVMRLQRGCQLVAGRNGISVRQYWQAAPKRELHLPRDDEYVAAFSELFGRVVKDHLRSRAPVGLMMSGGLDSTSVAATAAPVLQETGKRLATYTEVPRPGFNGAILNGRYADETPYVAAMARMYGNLDLNLVRTDGRFYLQDLDRFFAAAETPLFNPSNNCWYDAILRLAGEQGVSVLLTGQDGNLTISRNGGGLLRHLIAQGKWLTAFSEARALVPGNRRLAAIRRLVSQGCLPLLPAPVRRAVKGVLHRDSSLSREMPWRMNSALSPAFAREHKVQERARDRGYSVHSYTGAASHVQSFTLYKLLTDHESDLVCGYKARFGIDLRDPTGDARIVEFCLSLPEEQYLRGGVSRWLIRRAMADRLPKEVLENRERGLQTADWFERLRGAREEVICELSRIEQCQLARSALDLERMRHLVEHMSRTDFDANRNQSEYRNFLGNGLVVGKFLCWLESGG